MGRTEKSQGLAPPAIRKDMRAKQARHIVNKTVPAILASNSRARRGADGSELIVDPGVDFVSASQLGKEKEKGIGGINGEGGSDEGGKYMKRKGQGRRKAKGGGAEDEGESNERGVKAAGKGRESRRQEEDGQDGGRFDAGSSQQKTTRPLTVRIVQTDTLTAAHTLVPRARNHPNPCVLNMASPLRPGGGVLAGATSQEEFLCARTTLLPSLRDAFYRLPELGAIFTRDVLVFRSARALDDPAGELSPPQRWWVDVVSAGMLRFPDLEGDEDEEKRLSKHDRRAVEAKMRAVLRIAVAKGAKKVVLGAWGCGAYGNPAVDIAGAWRAVLLPETHGQAQGNKKQAEAKLERWNGLEEVVFAINNRKMAGEFARVFGGLEVETGPDGHEEEGNDETDEVAEELKAKIAEMEGQVEKVWNADLKQRMSVILDGLKSQLRERESSRGNRSVEDTSSEPSDDDPNLTDEDEEILHHSSDEWQVRPID